MNYVGNMKKTKLIANQSKNSRSDIDFDPFDPCDKKSRRVVGDKFIERKKFSDHLFPQNIFTRKAIQEDN